MSDDFFTQPIEGPITSLCVYCLREFTAPTAADSVDALVLHQLKAHNQRAPLSVERDLLALTGPPGVMVTERPKFDWPEDTQLRSAIMQALGAASMCWENPEGAGEFLPERAIAIGDALEEFVRRWRRNLS